MLDYTDYTTGSQGYQGNGNGYDHLQGDWATFYKVAKGFTHRVKLEDRQDFLHDLLLTMAKAKARYQASGKTLTEAGLVRVACYGVAEYWRKQFRHIHGTDCGRCNADQRHKCRAKDLYRECPKAIRIESLDRLIEDSEGNQIGLCEMIADDHAIDVVAMLDAKHLLQGFPHRFIRIAFKKYAGYPLTGGERDYLCQHKRKLQKTLLPV